MLQCNNNNIIYPNDVVEKVLLRCCVQQLFGWLRVVSAKKMSMPKKGGEALQLYVNVGRPLTELRNVFVFFLFSPFCDTCTYPVLAVYWVYSLFGWLHVLLYTHTLSLSPTYTCGWVHDEYKFSACENLYWRSKKCWTQNNFMQKIGQFSLSHTHARTHTHTHTHTHSHNEPTRWYVL